MKAMKLKSCFLLIGLLLVCNVYAQELCRADFLPKASAAFDLLTQKYSEERIVRQRTRSVTWICQSRCLGMPFVNGRKMRN